MPLICANDGSNNILDGVGLSSSHTMVWGRVHRLCGCIGNKNRHKVPEKSSYHYDLTFVTRVDVRICLGRSLWEYHRDVVGSRCSRCCYVH